MLLGRVWVPKMQGELGKGGRAEGALSAFGAAAERGQNLQDPGRDRRGQSGSQAPCPFSGTLASCRGVAVPWQSAAVPFATPAATALRGGGSASHPEHPKKHPQRGPPGPKPPVPPTEGPPRGPGRAGPLSGRAAAAARSPR